MANYYKFAERQADSFVNWAEIGKGLTDMIQTEVKIREDKKANIDKVTRENLKALADSPTGQHEGINTWTLKYADDARQAILLQDKLLKQGLLKMKDYTIMRQNINDGTDELFSTVKGYQQVFKEKMDRLNSNDPANKSQSLEVDLMSMIEGFSDFSKSKVLIDPTNFSLSVGIMEPDPNNNGVLRVSKEVATTSFLKKVQNMKFDYFDSEAAATQTAKNIGSYLTTVIGEGSRLEGSTLTVENALAKPETEKYIRQKIKSLLSNPYNVTSILTEDLVEDKDENPYVSSISGKEGNVIKYVFNSESNLPVAVPTEEQMKAAEEYMYGMIKSQIDFKSIEGRYSKPQPNVGRAEEKPTGPSIDIQETYISRVKQKTGLAKEAFDPSGSTTSGNLQSVLSKIPGGTDFNVVPDEKVDGLVNLMRGDQVVRSFNVKGIDRPTQQKYLDEFTEIISNLAGTDGMVDYLSRTGGVQQSGGVNYGDK
jgi:hypothetical protein